MMGWPTFETVRFDLADPEVASLASQYPCVLELATDGAPHSALGQCEADLALTIITTHRRVVSGYDREVRTRPGGPLIRFASGAGIDNAVALDPTSGEVLFVLDPAGLRGEPLARLMNSSLAHLRATVQAVIGRFPFYEGLQSDDRQIEEERAQNDLIRLIDEADPRAVEEPGPWGEFPWDVGMGDFDTASVVGSS
jgi:hypothetical protein